MPTTHWIEAAYREWGTLKAKRRALAERRKIVGHSQETLAQALGVELTTIGRWERGETSPQPWSRPKLADALEISLEQLDRMLAEGQPTKVVVISDAADEPADDPEHDPVLSAPWSHRGTVEAAVVLSGGDGRVKRRVFLSLTGTALTAPAHQWLVHEPGPLVSGLSGRRVSAGLADRLPAMIAELRTMDDVAGGGSVLSLAQHEFGWVAGLLDQASYDEPTGRKLHIALAELGQLAGWGAYDAGQQGLAQRYNVAALRGAHTADDRPLGAHILGYMAKQAAHQGRPGEAVILAETALAGARGQQSPRLQAQLSVRHAYALATVHDASGCTEAISRALTQVDQFESDNDPPWLYWVNPAWIIVEAGNSLLQLGQADRAATMLDEGVALFDESFARDRQLYSTLLADALARPGKQRDLDAAASRGMAAIQLAESLDSTLSVDLLRDLYHQMTPHAKVPVVRDFLDQARGLVQV
ncbi:MAG: helix-turn-helix transcriptional regulator [Pseudonocardiaceae bacterium]